MSLLSRFLLAVLFPSVAFAADVGEITFRGQIPIANGGGTVSFNTHNLDANNDGWVVYYQMPKADTITQACHRNGSITGTSPTYKVSIQTPDPATAVTPDGTILGGGSPASKTYQASGASAVQCNTLDNEIALTEGQLVALVWAYESGTIDGSNFAQITTTIGNLAGRRVFPIGITRTAGTYARQENLPVFMLKSASAVYGIPVETIDTTVISSDTTYDEVANTFTLPAGSCDTFKMTGMECMTAGEGNAAKELKAHVYGANDRTFTLDSEYYGANNGSYRTLRFRTSSGAPDALTCGTEYRYGIESLSTSSGFGPIMFVADNPADLVAWFPAAMGVHAEVRADAGAWDDTVNGGAQDDRILACWPIISDITEPAAGSSGPKQNLPGSGGKQ